MYNRQTSQLKFLDAANGGWDFAINHTYTSLTFTKSWQKVMIAHGPHGVVSTVCAQDILVAKHKLKSGSSTQEIPHVLVEKQKKPRHTCYSVLNSHIHVLFGWPYYVQWCRKTRRRTMEKDGLMIRLWWWVPPQVTIHQMTGISLLLHYRILVTILIAVITLAWFSHWSWPRLICSSWW